MAILTAWEKHNKEDEDRFNDIIERLKLDVTEQETRISQLHEMRQKIEKALRKGTETASSLESRMRALAKDQHQKEVIELLVKMADADAESKFNPFAKRLSTSCLEMALHSDSALQSLRIKKQESSLLKVHKYEQIADRLISGNLDGK